jgi:hypothetical protein
MCCGPGCKRYGEHDLARTATAFAASGAATFTYGSGPSARTFLALNNGTAGFSATTDGIVEITGFSGSLATLAVV